MCVLQYLFYMNTYHRYSLTYLRGRKYGLLSLYVICQEQQYTGECTASFFLFLLLGYGRSRLCMGMIGGIWAQRDLRLQYSSVEQLSSLC